MKAFLLVLICSCSITLHAQQDSIQKVTTTVALLYNSNISYYGQTTTTDYPYALMNATVRFPFGLYLSAGGYQLLNYGSGISETDLGIGYEYSFNDRWNTGASFTRSFFPRNSPLLAASNENNFNISATHDGALLKSTFSADYAFGQQQDLFFSLSNSKTIELGSFLNEKNLISVEPTVEIMAGTRHFYETYSVEQEKRNSGKGKGAVKAQSGSATEEIAKNSFNLLSYNLKLPISLSRASYMLEASYQLSILGRKAADLKPQTSIYGVAFYYQF